MSTGVYRLGPNIIQEFHSASIPTPSDVLDGSNKPAFWKVDGDYMNLSMTCNWRFVNLNATFRPSLEFPAVRPLHVYCNVGTSSMVGGRITDLLREIKYHPQNTTHFEPEYELWVAFHQFECGVSGGGGGTHAIVARVLGRGRQHGGGQSRDRFVA